MKNVGDVGCLGCGMFRMWDVWDVVCLGCGVFGIRDIQDVGCLGCGMFKMWDVWIVGCFGCGMFEMWDVKCGMLAYKIFAKETSLDFIKKSLLLITFQLTGII